MFLDNLRRSLTSQQTIDRTNASHLQKYKNSCRGGRCSIQAALVILAQVFK